jgi:hypothetical protein
MREISLASDYKLLRRDSAPLRLFAMDSLASTFAKYAQSKTRLGRKKITVQRKPRLA